PTDAASSGRGWPSPRTWDMAARLLTAAESVPVIDGVPPLLVAGAVGEAAAVELLVWLVEADLPDPEVVLADPASFVLPDRQAGALAAPSAVTAAVVARPSVDRWLAGWVVLGRAADTVPDVAAVAARALARARPADAPVPPEAARFAPVLR